VVRYASCNYTPLAPNLTSGSAPTHWEVAGEIDAVWEIYPPPNASVG